MRVTSQDLREALDRVASGRVAVVGDLMIDQYLDGDTLRISPEAPVPVVEVEAAHHQPGGAANVARNVRVLGGDVSVVGLVGADPAGKDLVRLLEDQGVPAAGLVEDGERPTTVKTRVRARGQQIVRVDRERSDPASPECEEALIQAAFEAIERSDALLLEDNDKGVLTPGSIERLVAFASDAGKPVTVDPKFRNFFRYEGVTLFKPNLQEVEKSMGTELDGDKETLDAGPELRRRLHCEAVLLTRGHRGMTLFDSDREPPFSLRPSAREVFDVSGAGDTVIATLTLAVAAGVPLRVATVLSSIAAGIEVGRMGVSAVEPAEILAAIGEGERTWGE